MDGFIIAAVAVVVFLTAILAAASTSVYKDNTEMERVSCAHDAENNEMDCTRITHKIEKFSVPVGDAP